MMQAFDDAMEEDMVIYVLIFLLDATPSLALLPTGSLILLL